MGLIESYGTTNAYIIKQMDRFATMKKSIFDTVDPYTSTRFWILVDNTGDEAYENTVKGTQITEMDSRLNQARIGHMSQDWFTLHSQYFNSELNINNGLTGFLNSISVRVHEDFANVYFEATSSRLPASIVFADELKETNVLYTNTGGGVAARSLPLTLGDTRLVVDGGGTLSSLVLGTTNENTVSISSNFPASNGTEVVGESSSASILEGAGSIILSNSSRASFFSVNQYVLIESVADNSLTEVVRLHSETAPNTSTGTLTLAEGTLTKYNYSGGATVYPLYNKVATATVASGDITIKPVNDRAITWGSF